MYLYARSSGMGNSPQMHSSLWKRSSLKHRRENNQVSWEMVWPNIWNKTPWCCSLNFQKCLAKMDMQCVWWDLLLRPLEGKKQIFPNVIFRIIFDPALFSLELFTAIKLAWRAVGISSCYLTMFHCCVIIPYQNKCFGEFIFVLFWFWQKKNARNFPLTLRIRPFLLKWTHGDVGKKVSETENVELMGLMKCENWRRQTSLLTMALTH